MSLAAVSAILLGRRHGFICSVPTDGRRLLELLTDNLSEFLRLRDVQVILNSAPDKSLASLPTAMVRKSAIGVAIITANEHEAPQRRLASFVPKERHPLFLTLSGFEISATVHLPRWGDPMELLSPEKDTFFPVTSATLSWTDTSAAAITAPVMIVQRQWVEMFSIDNSATVLVEGSATLTHAQDLFFALNRSRQNGV